MSKPYDLFGVDTVPWDDRLPSDHVVIGSGVDAWGVSYPYPVSDPTDVTLSVHRYFADPTRGGERHPTLDGLKFTSLEAASRAAYEGGVLFLMRYRDARVSS